MLAPDAQDRCGWRHSPCGQKPILIRAQGALSWAPDQETAEGPPEGGLVLWVAPYAASQMTCELVAVQKQGPSSQQMSLSFSVPRMNHPLRGLSLQCKQRTGQVRCLKICPGPMASVHCSPTEALLLFASICLFAVSWAVPHPVCNF